MRALFKEKLEETLRAVGPLLGAICALQVTLVGASTAMFVQFVLGAVLVTSGLMLLFTGIDLGVLPMGRFIGSALPQRGSVSLLLAVAFAMGFATTAAEPDVLILAGQVELASGGRFAAQMLVYVVSAGVGLFVAIAMLRIIAAVSMAWLLTAIYGSMLALSLLAPSEILPLAYDAGSVTTGVLAGPVILAIALGVTSVLAGRSAVCDGFGLLGIGSAGPIIVLLLLGVLQ